jgi:hypothetical protein
MFPIGTCIIQRYKPFNSAFSVSRTEYKMLLLEEEKQQWFYPIDQQENQCGFCSMFSTVYRLYKADLVPPG